MTFTLGGTPVKIHGMLPVIWGFMLFFQGPGLLLPTLAALAIHEAGHLIAAKYFGVVVEEVEITPFGGVIALRDSGLLPPMRGFLLAFAGPFFSILGCLLAASGCRAGLWGFAAAQRFARYNLLLAAVNLFPVLPLDGGGMLRHLLCRKFSYAAVTRILLFLGMAAGGMLCALSLAFALRGELNLSPAFAGLYLCYAAALENRQGLSRYLTALIARRQKIEKDAVLPVETLAAGSGAPARVLLRAMRPGKYHQVLVLTPDGQNTLGILTERQFCEALLGDAGVSLAQALQKQEKDASSAAPSASGEKSCF